MRLLWFFCILLPLFTGANNSVTSTLQPGDLLFIEDNCGLMCDAIAHATAESPRRHLTHVAMVINDPSWSIEATQHGVSLTPVIDLISRAHQLQPDSQVWVARVLPQFQPLIPAALAYAQQQVGKPYNADFRFNSEQQFYCSQLITQSFRYANHQQPLFKIIDMNFNDPNTHQPIAFWQQYFDKLHETIPQGKPGSNPNALFHDLALTIVQRIS